MTAPAATLAHRLEGGGEGAVVLLLNGGMMSIAAWDPVASRLQADGRRVLRCDLRGQLLSPGEAHGDLDDHAEDVVALLDRLELASVDVLGTSFGAEVGLLLAATRPQRVRSLAAVTATDYATPDLLAGIDDLRRIAAEVRREGDRGRFHDRLVAEVYSPGYRREHREELAERRDQIERIPDAWWLGLEGILTCMETLDLRPHLAAVRCPTLVVTAAADAVLPPERSRALAAAIRGAELVEHPTSGHALVAEDPRWLARVYLSFLSRLDRRGSDRAEGVE